MTLLLHFTKPLSSCTGTMQAAEGNKPAGAPGKGKKGGKRGKNKGGKKEAGETEAAQVKHAGQETLSQGAADNKKPKGIPFLQLARACNDVDCAFTTIPSPIFVGCAVTTVLPYEPILSPLQVLYNVPSLYQRTGEAQRQPDLLNRQHHLPP